MCVRVYNCNRHTMSRIIASRDFFFGELDGNLTKIISNREIYLNRLTENFIKRIGEERRRTDNRRRVDNDVDPLNLTAIVM